MNKPQVAAISCQDMYGGIGLANGDLPWGKHKKDMAFFRQTTQNSICIMGRNTYNNLAKRVKADEPLLKNRICIVVTSDPGLHILPYTDTYSVDSVECAYNVAQGALVTSRWNNIFFIGGRRIYEECAQYCDTRYSNIIFKNYNADIFFPHDAYKDFKYKEATVLSDDLASSIYIKDKNG